MYRVAGGLKEITHVEYHVAPSTGTSSFHHTSHLVGWLSFLFPGEQSEHRSGSYELSPNPDMTQPQMCQLAVVHTSGS